LGAIVAALRLDAPVGVGSAATQTFGLRMVKFTNTETSSITCRIDRPRRRHISTSNGTSRLIGRIPCRIRGAMPILQRSIVIATCSAFLASLSAGCGGTTQPSQNGVKTLTATITPVPTSLGQQVAAPTAFTAINVTGALLANGTVGIAGTKNGPSLNINLTNITGAGTYPITSASWSDSTGVFVVFNGGSGSITFSTATTARIAGTFSFTANDIPNGNPAQKRVSVTNGVFDITNP
jgi:hypothetical protein